MLAFFFHHSPCPFPHSFWPICRWVVVRRFFWYFVSNGFTSRHDNIMIVSIQICNDETMGVVFPPEKVFSAGRNVLFLLSFFLSFPSFTIFASFGVFVISFSFLFFSFFSYWFPFRSFSFLRFAWIWFKSWLASSLVVGCGECWLLFLLPSAFFYPPSIIPLGRFSGGLWVGAFLLYLFRMISLPDMPILWLFLSRSAMTKQWV